MNKIELFLKELRDSSDKMYGIFTDGSCVRLYFILKIFYPKAKMYWSTADGHAITKIKGQYYDIGGKLSKVYLHNRDYFYISPKKYHGYSLLKHVEQGVKLSVITEKYYRKDK